MRLRKVLSILIAVLGLVFTQFYSHVYAREARTSRVTIIDPPGGETKNHYIAQGESVEVVGNVSGDVYALGGNITVSGNIDGDLIAFGATVLVNGSISQNIRAFGGDVLIRGSVGRNLFIVASRVDMSDQAIVNGGAVVVSGEFVQNAPILGQLNIYSGLTVLSNTVGGSVEVVTRDLSLTNTADIKNNLIYTSDQEAYIQKGANISGRLSRNSLPENSLDFKKRIESYRRGISLGARILSFLTLLLTGIVFLRLFPKLFTNFSKGMENKWWKNLLTGFAMLIVIPIIVLLLMITLVGVPLALTVSLFFIFSVYFSKILFASWLGNNIVKNKRRYLSFLVGLITITLFTYIPYVGGILSLFVFLITLGILTANFKEYFGNKR